MEDLILNRYLTAQSPCGLIVKHPETSESGLVEKGNIDTVNLCNSCGNQREDRVSTPGCYHNTTRAKSTFTEDYRDDPRGTFPSFLLSHLNHSLGEKGIIEVDHYRGYGEVTTQAFLYLSFA